MPECRFCGAKLEHTFADLGPMPLANAYLDSEDQIPSEPHYPLHARVCGECLLVQTDQAVVPEAIFGDYAYFSSYSTSWVEHGRRFASSAIRDLKLDEEKLVLEVGSNDGYLLRHFASAGVPVLGVEPAANVAAAAVKAGIPTEVAFFGRETAQDLRDRGLQADLVVANNVFAHVPDPNDFAAGLTLVLKPTGVLSIEFPHLLRLITDLQFDTIYHEHFSYFSLRTAERVLAQQGLNVFDVEELPTHGGSLRIWCAKADQRRTPSRRTVDVRRREDEMGLSSIEAYVGFGERIQACRESVTGFLAWARAARKSVAAYGAAAKGNTLLNFCGVTTADIPYVADRSPHKQGKLLPGTHIPVTDPSRIGQTRPDYLILLAWNLRNEICEQMSFIKDWGGKFVVPVPEIQILSDFQAD